MVRSKRQKTAPVTEGSGLSVALKNLDDKTDNLMVDDEVTHISGRCLNQTFKWITFFRNNIFAEIFCSYSKKSMPIVKTKIRTSNLSYFPSTLNLDDS